ncbi:hypothetical protein [Kineococcus aurantiacus]|uniref:Uncharacterized protein n=1 Tax=Kineococcus aurantiacus TaxID=37633 RepID=A0A7Y9ASI0_9ACTN|nr:hypothetical protein [Kineococcus aurantiacus]NYD21183.1 hypothetical protein [Kineococcus aurantiacus]
MAAALAPNDRLADHGAPRPADAPRRANASVAVLPTRPRTPRGRMLNVLRARASH